MLREIITVLLIPAISAAQTVQSWSKVQIEPATGKGQQIAAGGMTMATVTRYDKLRRGHEEEIAVFPGRLSSPCPGCLPSPKQNGEISAVSLELEPAPGFTVRYGDGRHYRSVSHGSLAYTQAGRVFLMKLRVAGAVAAGDYLIKGKLTYRVFKRGKYSELQQAQIAIPVTVVQADAAVRKGAWPYKPPPDHKVRNFIATALLFPVLVPAFFVVLLYFVITEDDFH